MSPDPFARAVELGREFATALRRSLGVMHVTDEDASDMLDAARRALEPPATVDDMAGLFEGGPDSVEWLREQRGET